MDDLLLQATTIPPDTTADLTAALAALQAHHRYLTLDQRDQLTQLLGANPLDVHEEVKAQYALVMAIRNEVVDARGTLKANFDARVARELLTASTSWIALYLKSMERMDKDKELAAIEAAFIETVKTLPAEQQDRYLQELERRLRTLGSPPS